MILASIPSPSQGVWHIGDIPIRGYALCIIAGVIAAVWIGERRWIQRGGSPGVVGDVAVWAVPFGLVGGRLYHVLTDPELYFGEGKDPITALYIWRGGLGIWGAIALGGVGAYIGCRRRGARFSRLRRRPGARASRSRRRSAAGATGSTRSCSASPPICPGGWRSTREHRPLGYEQDSTFHPTFLYECIWNLGVAGLVIWADRKYKLGYGRAFALYVMAYTAGRGWIEYMRIDTRQPHLRTSAQCLDVDRLVRVVDGVLRHRRSPPSGSRAEDRELLTRDGPMSLRPGNRPIPTLTPQPSTRRHESRSRTRRSMTPLPSPPMTRRWRTTRAWSTPKTRSQTSHEVRLSSLSPVPPAERNNQAMTDTPTASSRTPHPTRELHRQRASCCFGRHRARAR